MKLEHLDPRFLSKSRREALGLPWPYRETLTTTETSPETSPTECATTGESGSSSPGQPGTNGAPWWEMDLSRWPGPDEHSEWETTLHISSLQFAMLSRAFGKSFKNMQEAMEMLNFSIIETEPHSVRVGHPVAPKKGKPQRTFDRRGRRLR